MTKRPFGESQRPFALHSAKYHVSTFFDELNDDLCWAYFDDFGESIAYQPVGTRAFPLTLTAIVHVEEDGSGIIGSDGTRLEQMAHILVQDADGTFQFGDIFGFRGYGWTFADSEVRPDGTRRIQVKSTMRYEASKSDTRRT
jgi:hypothetical protein